MPQHYGNSNKNLKEILKKYESYWNSYYWNEFVLKNENKVDWSNLSLNPNITWEIVNANPDKPWDWDVLSYNPNITMEFVNANPDKPWSWKALSKNPLTKERELFMEKKLREHMAVFKIQTYWRRAHYNPKYKLCQEWLMRQYDEFGF